MVCFIGYIHNNIFLLTVLINYLKEAVLSTCMTRYIRQIKLEEIGKQGQEKICAGSVIVVGVGALGTATSELLVRAGIGKICLIDGDSVSLVNLHRQLLFEEADDGKKKAFVAKEKLNKINSDVEIEIVEEFLDENNVDMLLTGYDLILDCTDNMRTRKIINDYCLRFDKIWIYAAASSTKGNVLVVDNPQKFNSIFKTGETFDNCKEIGVINTVTAIVSSLQVTEAIKIIVGKAYCKKLIRFNVWDNSYELFEL